jgi:hypothetical protein
LKIERQRYKKIYRIATFSLLLCSNQHKNSKMSKAFIIQKPMAYPELTVKVNQVYRTNGVYYVVVLIQKNRVFLRTIDTEDATKTEGQKLYNINDLRFSIYDWYYVGVLTDEGIIFQNTIDFKHFIPN